MQWIFAKAASLIVRFRTLSSRNLRACRKVPNETEALRSVGRFAFESIGIARDTLLRIVTRGETGSTRVSRNDSKGNFQVVGFTPPLFNEPPGLELRQERPTNLPFDEPNSTGRRSASRPAPFHPIPSGFDRFGSMVSSSRAFSSTEEKSYLIGSFRKERNVEKKKIEPSIAQSTQITEGVGGGQRFRVVEHNAGRSPPVDHEPGSFTKSER